MAKNRNTFEKSQRENTKRRKAEEKRALRRRKIDEPDSAELDKGLKEHDGVRSE